MTGTSTAGAEWKGGGEIRALTRIVGGSSEEDEYVPDSVGHNLSPHAIAHETTAADIALEEQAQVVERVLAQTEETNERAGRELANLLACFCSVEMGRRANILRLHEEGLSQRQIAARVGISQGTVSNHLKQEKKGIQTRLDPKTKGRFLTWAVARFKRPRRTLSAYLYYELRPGVKKVDSRNHSERRRRNSRLGRLMQADHDGKVTTSVFKRAFLALGDRGAASRAAVACWIISLEARSDDPQEIARWFAAHRLV